MIDIPKDIVNYTVICENFPIPRAYFETYDLAKRWVEIDQPNNRPYYIIKRTEHFELCNQEENETVKEINNVEKKGRWIFHKSKYTGYSHRECSFCNVWFRFDMPRNSYCPNCGARMEGGEGMSDSILAAGLTASNVKWRDVIEKKKTAQEWIPVDRLPKNDDLKIITIKDEHGDHPYFYTDFGWYLKEGDCWIVNNEKRTDVIAWCQLPNPYEEKK